MSNRVVVIGGGAAGMMASIISAQQGSTVVLLEPNEKLGKKLNITGKGRCNVTNNSPAEVHIANIPTNGRFLYSAFASFDANDTISFFEKEGVALKTERGNRVFPVSDSAYDITDALKRAMKRNHVTWIQDRACKLITKDETIQAVQGEKNQYPCDKVVIATGGKSYPGTGSTGDGYALASDVGHTITPIFGSLIPLVSKDDCCLRMQGISLKNVTLKIFEGSKNIFEEFGEMLFTHFGISGPIVLSASSHMHHVDFSNCFAEIDLKPALDEEKLEERLLREARENSNKVLETVMHSLLPASMVSVFLDKYHLNGSVRMHSLSKEGRKVLLQGLKHFRFSIDGLRPINEAIITSGGVKVSEINPKTMESKLIRGLFFAGEVLDVDAYTGGFNLQIAWSTAYLAGMNVSKESVNE